MNLLAAVWQWTWMGVVRAVAIVLGLVVVAIAVPFRVSGLSASDARPIVNLPRWAFPWGNDYDGLKGDGRGWWAAYCDEEVFWGLIPLLRKLGLPIPLLLAGDYLAMWWWAAVRNPTNNLRLLPVFSATIVGSLISYKGDPVVEDKPGQGGWQWVHEWSATRAFVVRLGFKVKPSHQGTDEPPKGVTFKINPLKSI